MLDKGDKINISGKIPESPFIVYLDRDGVVNVEKHLLHKAEELELIEGVAEAIKKLNRENVPVFVLSNQTVVARGMCDETEIDRINNKMLDDLGKKGAEINGTVYCLHSPKADIAIYREKCQFRKPNTGMIKEIEKKLKIKPIAKFVVGDMARDLLMAKKAGAISILVKTGHGGEDKFYKANPDIVAKDLEEAVNIILNIIKNRQTQALILAGGKGTRLQNPSADFKKEMLAFGGKPLLERQIESLVKAGIIDIYISLCHNPQVVRNFFKDKYPKIKLRFVLESEPKGTAGSLNNIKRYIKNDLLVLYGDVFHNVKLQRLIDFHKRHKALASLIVRKSDHPEDSDLVSFDKNNSINKIIFKPHNLKSGFGNTGILIINKKNFNNLPKKKMLDFIKDIIPMAVEKKKAFALEALKHEYIKDIGTRNRYNMVLKDIKERSLYDG